MQTFSRLGVADQTFHKSRFIARAQRCETERELALFLRQFASEHPNASHLAYAFRLKTAEGVVPRFSDAGEPSGTAGKPIMQILDGQDYVNCCVAVIRYYGGVNLGTGGLVRAYGGTAKLAIDDAGIVPFVEMMQIQISVGFKRVDELTREISKLHGQILDKKFDDSAHFLVKLPAHSANLLRGKFQN
jgi:uncharacterized YigZ family protein